MGASLRRHRSAEIVTDHPDNNTPSPPPESPETAGKGDKPAAPREKVNWLVEIRGLC